VFIMSTKSAVVLATGTANAAKLFVAALAFTSAYVGFSAYDSAGSAAEPVQTVTLSARELPITTSAQEGAPAKAGKVTVSELADGAPGCAKTYAARSLVDNPKPGQTVLYGWKLSRWSASAKSWRTYLVDYSGFAGDGRNVEWRPEIVANPGWYRVELAVEGTKTVTSERFQVSC
jgi:hypothetical protein